MTTLVAPSFTLPSFNPLDFANRLKRVGVPDKQAEAEAEILHEAITHHVEAFLTAHHKLTGTVEVTVRKAQQHETKTESAIERLENTIERLEAKVDARFAEMDARMNARFAEVDAKIELLRKEIALSRRDTIIWLGGVLGTLLIAGFGAVITVMLQLMK